MSNCNCTSDIIRDGSSQLGRYLKALDPSYARIDGRSLNDLLVFAMRYAEQIRFYDIPESKINNGIKPELISWREFFRRDMAVIAASIGVLDTASIKKNYDEVRERLDEQPTKDKFAELLSISIGMASRIDRWYSVAIPENPLRNDLVLAIDSNLRLQTKQIVDFEEGYKLIDSQNPLKLDYAGIENKEVWGLKDTSVPDASIYQGSTLEDKIRYGALYADDIFNSFFSFLNTLVDRSEGYMQFALEQYPAHQPHMALFISFLELFQLAQEQMNGLTERMLNFYYRDVLHLTAKNSIPDKVHIVFELAKDVAEYDISKNTMLKAGKDALGIEQLYTTNTDLVVNQAKVKELKTIFIEKESGPPLPQLGSPERGVIGQPSTVSYIKSIYARPIANSADGYGAAFETDMPKWPTFGKGKGIDKKPKNICEKIDAEKDAMLPSNAVQTGFAIASPELVLQGGKRLIKLNLDGVFKQPNGESLFEIWLTGEKEWLKINKKMPDGDKQDLTASLRSGIFGSRSQNYKTSYYLENNSIFIYLPIAEQPIIAFNEKLHPGYSYNTTYPVLQLILNPEINIVEDIYKDLKIENFSLEVKVGSINPSILSLSPYHFDGLKTFVIQNDEEILVPGKAFNPFTHYPSAGKSLYIGSSEVFNKPLGQLAVNILKTQQPLVRGSEYGVSVLHDRDWYNLSKWDDSSNKGEDFTQIDLTLNILNDANNEPVTLERSPIEEVTEWKPATNKGFIRINNLLPVPDSDLGFLFESQNMSPKLEIKEISLSYHSKLEGLENEIDQFFQVYPFGVVEIFNEKKGNDPEEIKRESKIFAELDKSKDYLLVKADNILLPQYNYLGPDDLELNDDSKEPLTEDDDGNNKVVAGREKNILDRMLKYRDKIIPGNNQYSGSKQEEGMLFIGLENAKPLQSISLLFQFAEGSAEDEDSDPPPIHWSYLTNNEWRPMRGEDVISDGTYGFQTTGIVKLNIPSDATNNNTIITKGMHWFCISVTENSNRIPQLIDVVTQAVEAKFEDQDNDQSHFDKALAAGSISKLAVEVAELSTVKQPFASFNGKHKEIGKEFYTRVSERLRHKGRAINSWDYEHLVLDRFPSVYKIKCITHTDPNCLCREGVVSKAAKSTLNKKYKLVYEGDFKLIETSQKDFDDAITEMVGKTDVFAIFTVYYTDGTEDIVQKFYSSDSYKKDIMTKLKIAGVARLSEQSEKGELSTVGLEVTGTVSVMSNEKVCCGPQIAPGHVLLIPIANLKNRNSINPLQPKTSRRVLLEIEAYLKKLTSPFVHVHAKNPVYEQIIVSFKVKFYSGIDIGFHLKKLNDEIVHFLTPWAFDESAEVKFGEKIYASSIINFIEERPYVDFITDFIMGVCKEECCPPEEKILIGDKTKKDSEINEEDGSADGKIEFLESSTFLELLADICGCDGIEELLEQNKDTTGEIVAQPSSPRSLLVSVPRHIIIPYVEPERISPCEQRKKDKEGASGKTPLLKDETGDEKKEKTDIKPKDTAFDKDIEKMQTVVKNLKTEPKPKKPKK